MLLSMTGYGSGKAKVEDFTIVINLQSVNSRFLEHRFRLPGILSQFESDIKTIISKAFTRGEIKVFAEFYTDGRSPFNIKLNKSSLQSYIGLLNELEKNDVATSPVGLSDLMKLDDVISKEIDPQAEAQIKQATEDALEQAIKNLNHMHELEGQYLQDDIEQRVQLISASIKDIFAARKDLPEIVEMKITEVEKHMTGKFPQDRIAQEVTFALSKMDIEEELVRLDSHIVQFNNTLQEPPPIGSKLNFIIQEIHREANTIAAKSQLMEIISKVIEIKEQTERIREQLRNVQ